MLTPLAVDPAHPFPFIPNFGFTIALELVGPVERKHLEGADPAAGEDPALHPPAGRATARRQRFIALENVVGMFTPEPVPGLYACAAHGLFRVIRDSDLEVEEEAEDLVLPVRDARSKRRRRGSVIRLEFDSLMPEELRAFVAEELDVEPDEIFVLDGMLALNELSEIVSARSAGAEVQAL